MDYTAIQRALARWYDANHRDLPWRRSRDPYAILVSEVMLQQTRVAAVIPYYHRFLERFPTPADLAAADETEVLTMWAGLGYYSRARNLQKAAVQVTALRSFPQSYAAIRELAGVGDYTAAAVASIAFGLPHASIDGNVRRVVTRLAGVAEVQLTAEADALLDRRNPGRSNQALMELGATICVPGEPRCAVCPVKRYCGAFRLGLQAVLPLAKPKLATIAKERTLLVIRKSGQILLTRSDRVLGFWELPEDLPGAQLGAELGLFRHAITNSRYTFQVREARIGAGNGEHGEVAPDRELVWWPEAKLGEIPLSTAAKKALRCLETIG